jgi:phosphoribosylformimino-5-aminoimidazole carboxamide ribotide isomerase
VIVIPAIDLRGGRAVRLFRGDPRAETEYSADPVEVAERFESEGARRLHVVDLDAALDVGENRDIVVEICRHVAIPVQLGGGLRSAAAVEAALESGIARAVVGTAAATDPDLVASLVERFDDRIVVAIDVKDDRVMVHGWREARDPIEHALPALVRAGAPRFLVTSIRMDGTMDGPDLSLYERALALTRGTPVIASGGIRGAGDVWALRELGVESAVVGKALYVGTLKLSEVVRG